MTVIEITDELAVVLQAKAAAEGLSLVNWLQKLAQEKLTGSPQHPHIGDVILENMKDVPPEEFAKLPKDRASEHDHYLYGSSKKEA